MQPFSLIQIPSGVVDGEPFFGRVSAQSLLIHSINLSCCDGWDVHLKGFILSQLRFKLHKSASKILDFKSLRVVWNPLSGKIVCRYFLSSRNFPRHNQQLFCGKKRCVRTQKTPLTDTNGNSNYIYIYIYLYWVGKIVEIIIIIIIIIITV